MPNFQYQAVTTSGTPASGTIQAASRADAIRTLRQRGETATKLTVAGVASALPRIRRAAPAGDEATHAPAPGRAGSMRRSELAGFIREIATALEAGLPLMHALRAVAKQSSSPRQKALLDHLISRIEAGNSFAQAAKSWGPPFNDMTVGMLKAGDASGRMEVVMMQLADLLDRELETKRSVASALVYPAILIVLLTIGITVIVTFIIPRVLNTLEGTSVVLPLPTRIVKGFAEFVGGYWWLIIGVIVIAVMAWRTAMSKPHIRMARDRFLLRIPVAGPLLRDVAVGRFTRVLGTLMAAGIPIVEAITITRDTLGNRAMEAVVDEVAIKIREGKSISEPMERSGYFPPLLIQIIDLGERSGRLDEMLTQAAASFDRRTSASIKIFTAALPPLIVVCMALVIGFVLLSVILPLMSLQSAIGG